MEGDDRVPSSWANVYETQEYIAICELTRAIIVEPELLDVSTV